MIHTSELLTSGDLPAPEKSASQAAGWKRLRFGDVCKVQGGFAFKSQEYEKSGVPLVRISNLVNGKVNFNSDTVYLPASKLDVHKDFILRRGDTLIAMSGATTGKMATFDMDSPALLNQRVGRFRILSVEACNPRFIALLVQQVTRQVLKEAYGAAQPNISPTQIEQISIPFPPLEEQNAIVSEIEKQFTRLEAGVSGLRRVQANLKRYRAAVLKAACEGKLVPTEAELARQEGRSYETGAQLLERILTERRQKWNGKGIYDEPANPDTAKLPPSPMGWTWVTAEQICHFITKGTTPSAAKLRNGTGDVQFLKVYNLTFTGYLDYRYRPVFISQTTHQSELARSKVRSGDVLINIVGPPLGQVAVVPDELSEANINQAIARFSPLKGVSNHFLSTALQSNSVMGWAIKRAKTTAGQANLTLELCRELPIPLPPLAEQLRIVSEVERRLSVVEELETAVNANLQRATRLRQSILQMAFTGGLCS